MQINIQVITHQSSAARVHSGLQSIHGLCAGRRRSLGRDVVFISSFAWEMKDHQNWKVKQKLNSDNTILICMILNVEPKDWSGHWNFRLWDWHQWIDDLLSFQILQGSCMRNDYDYIRGHNILGIYSDYSSFILMSYDVLSWISFSSAISSFSTLLASPISWSMPSARLWQLQIRLVVSSDITKDTDVKRVRQPNATMHNEVRS